jgi:Holliday junction DNA helicase RuvA
MIASLTGVLKSKNPTEVLIDVNGVGYSVTIPLSTYEKLGEVESKVTLLTHLHVREDVMQLFGFASPEERLFFKLLITVKGILSGITVTDLKQHIAQENISALTAIPGVGRKTAERLIIELRDKIGRIEPSSSGSIPVPGEENDLRQEALMALTSLGYNRPIAEKALRQVFTEMKGEKLSLQDLIKRALRATGTM